MTAIPPQPQQQPIQLSQPQILQTSQPNPFGQIGGMLTEILSSKKALTMIGGNAVMWTAIKDTIANHEQFAMVCVIGSIALTAVYIIAQAYVDTHTHPK